MFRFLARQPKPIPFIESLLMLAVIGWLNVVTGYEISLVFFYSVPIAFAVWLCDQKSAFLVAGLAGVSWTWADIATGHPYPTLPFQVWEISFRFSFFFLVALAASVVKAQDLAVKARIELLEHARKLEQQ